MNIEDEICKMLRVFKSYAEILKRWVKCEFRETKKKKKN